MRVHVKLSILSVLAISISGCDNTVGTAVSGQGIKFEFLQSALEMHVEICGDYPNDLQTLTRPGKCQILKEDTSLNDIWGNPYEYSYPSRLPSRGVKYDLFSRGEDKQLGTEDDIANWIPKEVWENYYQKQKEAFYQ
ncbi:type II secretion system protein GspG [Algicola sagamiensis]|uniref:type II secretion system protein GspG n=1 Tax=Algicola sagamiensis TaxID=163869 RepID=UPI00036AF154|nr:type II secretion system protein GspG [Algicola sagamiensis]